MSHQYQRDAITVNHHLYLNDVSQHLPAVQAEILHFFALRSSQGAATAEAPRLLSSSRRFVAVSPNSFPQTVLPGSGADHLHRTS